jgi:hypothetical protein
VLMRTGASRVVCANIMGVVRRAAGCPSAAHVGALPTCALIANGPRDVFLVLSAKVKKINTIARRRGGGGGARTLL